MSEKLANLRATIEAMTDGDWEARDTAIWSVDADHPDYDVRIAVAGRVVPESRVNQRDATANAAGICALHRSRLALLDLAATVGRLAAYEDNELTSEQFEERLDATVDAYRRLLEAIP